MHNTPLSLTRRHFLATAAMAASATALPFQPARAAAKYTRYNVTSPEGQKALASYAKGVAAMLKLPADHPQNWFRNAFIHLMDCPHGNWWFYVWHRGYLGFFERSIRALSGDDTFALPYWDWTATPKIPESLFDGVLTPTDAAYQPVTGNLALFTSALQKPLQNYWNGLSAAQKAQLKVRGYPTFDALWDSVTGYDPTLQAAISGNEAYATTCASRYLSRDNPALDPETAYDCSLPVIESGLAPTDYYNANVAKSFTSSKTPSHNTQPSGATEFSVLEGMPHNTVHNCIGGVGPLDPGPYGNMTNFLSPVDPIFFMHHSNMDRLWDVWTRKQQAMKLPVLPSGADLKLLAEEPFLFYVGGDGKPVGPTKAGDFFSTDVFEYDYQPGSGDAAGTPVASTPAPPLRATMAANVASVTVPNAVVQRHLAASPSAKIIALLNLPRPAGFSNQRSFDVLVNAPDGATSSGVDSPYYAGTVSFFGPKMPGMNMAHDITFAVPLPRQLGAFRTLSTTGGAALRIKVVPRGRPARVLPLKGVSIVPM